MWPECGEKRKYVNEIYAIRFSVHIWMKLYRCFESTLICIACITIRSLALTSNFSSTNERMKIIQVHHECMPKLVISILQQCTRDAFLLAKIDSCAPTPPKTFVLHAQKADAGNGKRTDRARYRSISVAPKQVGAVHLVWACMSCCHAVKTTWNLN